MLINEGSKEGGPRFSIHVRFEGVGQNGRRVHPRADGHTTPQVRNDLWSRDRPIPGRRPSSWSLCVGVTQRRSYYRVGVTVWVTTWIEEVTLRGLEPKDLGVTTPTPTPCLRQDNPPWSHSSQESRLTRWYHTRSLSLETPKEEQAPVFCCHLVVPSVVFMVGPDSSRTLFVDTSEKSTGLGEGTHL